MPSHQSIEVTIKFARKVPRLLVGDSVSMWLQYYSKFIFAYDAVAVKIAQFKRLLKIEQGIPGDGLPEYL